MSKIENTAEVLGKIITRLLVPPTATAIGAATAYLTGLAFGPTLLAGFAQLGVHGLTLWQIGAVMGFVRGSFLDLRKGPGWNFPETKDKSNE